MTSSGRRPATYDDILALPEHLVGELIDGELVVSPRPAPRHAVTVTGLLGTLVPPFKFGDGGPGGWWIFREPELHLGEHVLVPDLAGWRRERLRSVPKEEFFTLPPDWACEVLSPHSGRTDRVRKRPIYARAGISSLWLVEPEVETLEAFSLQDGFWVLLGAHGGDDAVRVEPFEDVVIQLSRLWDRPSATLQAPRMQAASEGSTFRVDASGPRAVVAGTNIKVSQIASEVDHLGMTPDEVVEAHPHLTLAMVHAALAYYYDHQELVRKEWEEAGALIDAVRAARTATQK